MTVISVGLVVLLTMVYFGLGGAMRNGIYENLTQTSGHLQLHTKDYRDIKEFDGLLVNNAEVLQEQLLGEARTVDPNAELVAALEVPGLLEGTGRSRGILLAAVEQPDAVRERFIKDSNVTGEFPASGDLESIALGVKLAKAIKVDIGDVVYMYAPGTEGYGAAIYTVTGLIDIPGSSQLAYVSLAAAQELAAPDAVSRLEVHMPAFNKLSDNNQLAAVRSSLQDVAGEGFIVETWAEANPSSAGLLEIQDVNAKVFTFIFFILAGLLVMNTVYLSVIERVREFGVMMALGTARRKMMGMVLSESLALCITGAIIGSLVGGAIVAWMSRGFSFPPQMAELYAEAGLPTVLRSSISTGDIVTTIIFVLLTGVMAALLPSITAARLEPVEAMRFTA